MEGYLQKERSLKFASYAGAEGFGGQDMSARTIFAPGKRRRINLVAACLNLWAPCALFMSLYCALSFKFHYQNPVWARLLIVIYFGIAITICVYTAYKRRKKEREGVWLAYTSISCVISVIAATVAGCLNFTYNQLPYYEINSLNTYPNVNPAGDWGQELMDAGRAYFADGSGLDMKKTIGFKNTDVFCVAPIVVGDTKMSHYDFWAVGKNCCSGVSSDFRCGQFNNPHARSGLRMVWDEDRPFYRLAVQQAEAVYNIQSPHPLFFYWIQDPVAEMAGYVEAGWRYYLLGCATHFALNLFAVLACTVIFSKIGSL